MTRLLGPISIIVLLAILIFTVFKNIQYPIMWGDEADTAMFAERILTYGYPKVHDAHNSLNYAMISGNVGVNEKYDAGTVSMWGQYYFTAIGAALARRVDDFYLKTAMLRIPHAVLGLLGILILPFSITPLIKDRNKKLLFWIIYLVFIILSISLLLHIKQVRSYALSVFFSSLFLIIFTRFYFFKSLGRLAYYILGTITLFLLVNSFPPGFLSLIVSVGLYVLLSNFRKTKKSSEIGAIKQAFKDLLPGVIVSFLMLPILKFFGTSQVSSRAYADIGFGLRLYLSYIERVVRFLFYYHFFSILIFMVAILLFIRTKSTSVSFFKLVEGFVSKEKVFSFMLFILVAYIPVVAFTPYMFDRYFIFLQPLTSLLIAYSFVIFLSKLSIVKDKDKRTNFILLVIYGLFLLFSINMIFKFDIIRSRLYELTHKFYGPMDYIVKYLADSYDNTRELTIDTNIEQPVLIYYLGSRVICDDSSECYSEPSDILIPRRGYLKDEFASRIDRQMNQASYAKVQLPVLDYPANNIPEFSLGLRHLFKTPTTDDPNEMVFLYVKEK
jgi:hypothetical protein